MSYPEDKARMLESLEQHKRELRLAADDIKDATQTWTSLRTLVRAHPRDTLVGGLLLGLWFGLRR